MRRCLWPLVLVMIVAALAACSGPEPPATIEVHLATPDGSATAAASSTTAPAAATGTVPASSVATPAGALGAQSAATPAGSPGGAGSTTFAYGFNAFLRGDDQGSAFNGQTFAKITGAGFGWVHFQLSWSQFEPNKGQWDPLPTDRIVQQAENDHVQLLVSLVDFPGWARDPSNKQLLANWSDYQEATRFIADRYRGKIKYWEIGNEENLAYTVGGTIRVSDYAHVLEAGYKGIKAAAPEDTVIFGALTPTGTNDPKVAIDDVQYLKQFYALQNGYFTHFFDALGMHANATHNAPDLMWPDKPGQGEWTKDGSFYFRRVEQLHQVMVDHKDTRPVWITEFGWTTANQAPGYEYGKLVSPQQQADYLVRAFQIARQNWPWCVGMFVWNLNYSVIAPPSDEKSPWAVLNPDWSPRPAYTALQKMPKD